MSAHKRDDGFSLIEMLVVLAIIGIMATLTITSYHGYRLSQLHRGQTREVVSVLRNMQLRAVTEETTYQCAFDTAAKTIKFYRTGTYPPTTAVVKTYSLDANLAFANVSFTHSSGSIPATQCFFYARGSADGGTLQITRTGSSKVYNIAVESLTGRVSYDDCTKSNSSGTCIER